MKNENWELPIEAACAMGAMNSQDLSDRLLDFAARVGKVVDAPPNTRLGRHVAGQMVRCGTSAPPNYEEACAAESRRDFIHKMLIGLKELRETRFWLRLIVKAKLLPKTRMEDLLDECGQLCKIVGQSVVTAKRGLKLRRTAPSKID
jgi:four helix bundle protein